jgi:hypothetical protein
MKTTPCWRGLSERASVMSRTAVIGDKVGTFLAWPHCPQWIKGDAMITMGIGFGAGVFYWLADYKLAFWILVYAIIYGALGALRDYNQTQSVYRQGSGLTIAILIPVAWHIGELAGYFW